MIAGCRDAAESAAMVISLDAARARRHAAGEWPPTWCWRCGEPPSWSEAERSWWAPEWREDRLLLGWPA
jgi:hypothetical protein